MRSIWRCQRCDVEFVRPVWQKRATHVLIRVAKLDSQVSSELIQGSSCGGHRDGVADGDVEWVFFEPCLLAVLQQVGRPTSHHQQISNQSLQIVDLKP